MWFLFNGSLLGVNSFASFSLFHLAVGRHEECFANMGLQQYVDLDLCLAVAVDCAKKAGQMILNNFHSTKTVERKGMVDLVTETDKACEDLIFKQLKLSFPAHELIGEETSAANG